MTPEDALHTVLEKAKLIGDRILDGKSVAVALGELKNKREEEADVKNLTLKERHIWQQWKRGRGALPEMQWQFQKQIQDSEEIDAQTDPEQGQGAKRKVGSTATNDMPKRKQARKDSRGLKKISPAQQEALAELYHMPSEFKVKVEAVDVQNFQTQFPQLRSLLNALTKIVEARHEYKCKMATEEQKVLESHSTTKAIFMIEKQVKWIMEEANSTVDAIQEQVTLMRGRVAALEGEADEEEADSSSSDCAESIQEEMMHTEEDHLVCAKEKEDHQGTEVTMQDEVTHESPPVVARQVRLPLPIVDRQIVRYEEPSEMPNAHAKEQMLATSTKHHERDQSEESEKSATASKYPRLCQEEQETIKEQIHEEESQYVETYAYSEEQQYHEEMQGDERGPHSDRTIDSNGTGEETSLEKRYPGYTDAQSESGQAHEAYVAQHRYGDGEKEGESSPVEVDYEEEEVAPPVADNSNQYAGSVEVKTTSTPNPWMSQAVRKDLGKVVEEIVVDKEVEEQGGLEFYHQSRSFFGTLGM